MSANTENSVGFFVVVFFAREESQTKYLPHLRNERPLFTINRNNHVIVVLILNTLSAVPADLPLAATQDKNKDAVLVVLLTMLVCFLHRCRLLHKMSTASAETQIALDRQPTPERKVISTRDRKDNPKRKHKKPTECQNISGKQT
ncbi:hypothetical protein BaRGS_00016351 [Batillaria attramentaria]|uniref:Uncharacterized protein n=1 Tax=Batillaria attramentaria TaxID=370345 RepID=A0ABD0KZ99_9CAEN